MTEIETDLARFVRGDCDPRNFPHREHARMAFEMLRRHSFPETLLHYSQGLRRMTTRAGKPEAYHETITVAFLSLIAERMDEAGDFDSFALRNPDLFERDVLARWYRPERLATLARGEPSCCPSPSPDDCGQSPPAASSIMRATSSGCEMKTRWLAPLIAVVFAPERWYIHCASLGFSA
jgi:hypothetical protein